MKRLLILLLLILHAGVAVGAEFGRLFFTPVQRATLDNARKQNIRVDIGNDNTDEGEPVPQNISINGLVKRSDGKSTVWLNNRAVTEQQAGGVGVSTRKEDNRVKLTVPESGRIIDLKVGQSVEVVTGTVEEGYARGNSPPNEVPAPGAAKTPTTPVDVKKVTPPTAASPK